jgi:FeS assembly SUF system regulator
MADYGVVAMTHIARRADELHSAASVAQATGVPLPSATKLLKQLVKSGILTSQRGAKGGYALSRKPAEISVAELIVAIDGPIALADCLEGAAGQCGLESFCSVRSPWQKVSNAIRIALEEVTLAEMIEATAYVPPPDEVEARPRAGAGSNG